MALGPIVSLRRSLFDKGRHRKLEVIEHLADILSDAPQVYLPHFCGKFHIGAKSDIFQRIALGDNYELHLVRNVQQRIDRTKAAIDVGANCGFYSVLLAKISVGSVVAVEPTQGALALLRRNLEINGVADRVSVFEGVASDKVGVAKLSFIEGREEYSSLGVMSHPSIAGVDACVREVCTTTIDALAQTLGEPCGFIKIDAEGHEFAVLRGAKETLLRHRPIVLAELADPLLRSNGSSALEVIEFVKSCGYQTLDPVDPGRRAGSKAYSDLLCIPVGS